MLDGEITIPASKSHTIRAVLIAALAEGTSEIIEPLESLDTKSAAYAARAFGASVEFGNCLWTVKGAGKDLCVPADVVDVGNSGTTLYMVMGVAALVKGWTVLNGDEQIRRRTAAPLIKSLNELGAEVYSTRANGLAPLIIKGRMTGGKTSVAAISSQYLSSLLISCPLADGDSEITVTELNERPYVEMTLGWLSSQGIEVETDDRISFVRIKGGNYYSAFRRAIPADFSSAAFPACAAAVTGGKVRLNGLEMNDSQGDKKIIGILESMGASVEIEERAVTITGGKLKGIEADLNEIPDALPMLAVTACFAEGETRLYNVAQARIKETDRITVMANELSKLGADIKELPDGLVIKGSGLKGGAVHGHGDHRVVMAMTVAGFASDNPVTVDTAEAADVTFPGFWDKMAALGGKIELKQ